MASATTPMRQEPRDEETADTDSESETDGREEASTSALCIPEAAKDGRNGDNPTLRVQTHWYETTVRLRLAYYVFNTLSLLLGVAMGVIIHIFFSVMGSTRATHALALEIHLMPITLLWSAVLVDEMLDVGLDGMDFPSLGIFRATLTVAMSQYFPNFTAREAELFALLSIEGLPLVGGVIYAATAADFSVGGLLTAYLFGGLSAVLLLSVVYVVVHVYVDVSPLREAQMVDLCPRLSHLGKLEVRTVNRDFSLDDEVGMKKRVWRCSTFVAISMAINLCLWLLSGVSGSQHAEMLIAGEMVIVALMYLAVRALAPRLLGKAFLFTFGLFVGLSFVLWYGASKQLPSKEGFKPLCLGPAAAGFGDELNYTDLPVPFTGPPLNGAGYGYPVCSGHWGNREMSVDNQFDILDLAALAYVSSFPKREEIEAGLTTMFSGTQLSSWQVGHVEDPETIGRWIVVDFPAQKTRVIAVRGTSTLLDVYADLEIYSRVSIFQFFSKLTPVLVYLGKERVRKLVSTTLASRLVAVQEDFWEPFLGNVSAYKRESLAKGWAVVLTGHSLGGALAGAASANQLVQGVGFSAPGLKYQTERMNLTDQALQYTFTEIQPSGDAVPRADEQMGAVNWIQCVEKAGVCHRLTKTSCELWRRCGDARGRDWRRMCSDYYSPGDLNM